MSGYQNLISPRSRAPIILSDDDEDGGFCSPVVVRSVPSSARTRVIPSPRSRSQERALGRDYSANNNKNNNESAMPISCSNKHLVATHKRSASEPYQGETEYSGEPSNQMERKSLAIPSSSSVSAMLGSPPERRGYGPTSILRQGSDSLAGDLMTRSTPGVSRMEDEAAAYKRRLESYRQAQHQQALLVARLQSKLLQYKQRCSNLESKMVEMKAEPEPYYQYGSPLKESPSSEFQRRAGVSFAPSPTTPLDMEDAIWKLDQERIRNENLLQLNRDLRGELEETRKVNNSLSSDLQKLSDDWEKLTKQMNDRENMWRAEEQAYSDFYASEHTKLLSLWKKISATKRDYEELKSTTGRDLAQLRSSFGKMCNQVSNGVISAAVSTPSPQQEAETSAFISQITQELNQARTLHDNLRKQLKERDDKIHDLETGISEFEKKNQTLEQDLTKLSTQDLALLQNSLKEIGKLLLNDFEQHGVEDGHDLHLTSAPAIYIYDENGENPTVFAESVVSAVQAALNKRQLQLHALQVNLASTKEQSLVARGHVEALEQELSKSEEKVGQLVDQNEKLKDAFENTKMERDGAQRNLDNLKNEKNILEQQRKALTSELESVVKIKNSVSTNLSKCEKALEACRDEISLLHSELEKTKDELSTKSNQLQTEQEMNLKLQEQLNSLEEDKEKNSVENKELKNQINELTTKYDDVTFQFERSEDSLRKWKMDAEILAEKLRSAGQKCDALDKDKRKWMEKCKEVEDSKTALEAELQDARNDLTSLRREILETERLRTDLESKIEREVSRADGAENKLGILEAQFESQRDEFHKEINLASERADILSDELNETRRELETVYRTLEKVKADLSNTERMHMEAVHIVEQKEMQIKNMSESLEKAKEEKLSFEELEETMKAALIEKDKKIDSIERQMNDIKTKSNTEINSLRDKLTRTENELREEKSDREKEKAAFESKYSKEINSIKADSGNNEEKIKSEYDDKIKVLRAELEGSKKAEVNKLNNEIASTRQQIESMRVQYEEAILRAENDKQQGLLLAQQDQQGLSDKIRLLERELEDSKTERDRLKRECEQKCGHEKNAAASLRSELIKLKNELETTKQEGGETLKQIEIRCADIERERENALMLMEEVRGKLRAAEEREGELKRELADVNRRLKDSDNSCEHIKRELDDVRRTLNEVLVEKEKANANVASLKDEMSKRDSEISGLKKEFNRVTMHLKNMEKIKNELETELAQATSKLESNSKERTENEKYMEDLSDQLGKAKGALARFEGEVTELKVKLDAETERRDNAETQWRNTKKMLDEAENALNIVKTEEERLANKLAEAEEKYAAREDQWMNLADENKIREKKLLEEKHNLNVALNSVQQQIEHLTGKLQSAENRLKTLSDEKENLERMKKETESKLNQIASGFKRLGVGAGGTMDNPESARRVMTVLQTQMAAMQQDRDTLASQLSASRDSLAAVEMAKSQLEDQLQQLNRNLQTARSDIKTKDTMILNLEKDVALKNGELSRLADKVRECEDQLKNKEEGIRILRSEKDSLKEDWDRARQKWEENRAQYDSKWTKAEVNMRALEGDLNRMALVLQQKDAHVHSLEEKIAMIQKNNTDLEERCGSLSMTVEQLNMSLEKVTHAEQEWKDKYHNSSRHASDNLTQVNHLNEKLRSCQRDKTTLEQERNALSEKWEATSAALQDYKRQVQILNEKNHKLKVQSEEMTRKAVEKQIRMTIKDSGKEDVRQLMSEKLEMSRRMESLVEKIRDLERENRELERLKDSVPMKGISARHNAPLIRDNAIAVVEEENSDLRRKISKLEAEIRDLERRHAKHIAEVTANVKQERDFELERARSAKLQAERLLEARESNYRQQVARLEQQVAHLKEQLAEEIRRRQSFLSRSFRTGQEMRALRQTLGDSLRNVTMDPNPGTMDLETRRLDSALDMHRSASQASLLSPHGRDMSPSPYKRDYSPVTPRT